jgi:curved DNA-binding protein CbpA
LKFHPEKNIGDQDALNEKFKQIAEAYDVLCDGRYFDQTAECSGNNVY